MQLLFVDQTEQRLAEIERLLLDSFAQVRPVEHALQLGDAVLGDRVLAVDVEQLVEDVDDVDGTGLNQMRLNVQIEEHFGEIGQLFAFHAELRFTPAIGECVPNEIEELAAFGQRGLLQVGEQVFFLDLFACGVGELLLERLRVGRHAERKMLVELSQMNGNFRKKLKEE